MSLLLPLAAQERNNAMVGVAGAFLALSWIAVSLRVYVRGILIRSFGWDDWLMLVALTFFTLESVILIVLAWTENHYGLTAFPILARLLQYVVLEIAFYICTSIFLKLSLAVFLLRVIVERWQRWVIFVSVGFYTLFTIAYLFIAVFQCGDPTNVLLRHLENKCIAWHYIAPLNYFHSSLNALTDWIFAILPIFVLRKTKMPRQAKITVCFILALGAAGSIASLVRLAYIQGLNSDADNFFSEAVNIAIASNIEPGLGIVAGSLATLRPLLRAILEKTRVGWSSSNCFNTDAKGSSRSDSSAQETAVRVVEKPRNDFASYGFDEDLEKFGTTLVVATSTQVPAPSCVKGASSIIPLGMWDEPDSLQPLEEIRKPSTTCSSRKPSNSIYPTPSQPSSRKTSHASSRKASQISCSHVSSRKASHVSSRKASDTSAQRDPSKCEWENLEEAKKNWSDRRWNSQGDVRIQPSLLLPDTDGADT